MTKDPLAGLPSRSRIAELVLRKHRGTRGLPVPAPPLTAASRGRLPLARRSDYDPYRQVTT
ncbi:hypothetical protein [Streptomyces canus]|uniref:hypothetical protein n=1 Tax=Streptomyces canus TaxID=58343 RepID=UPI0022513711|nr:hypothetical protein [Streptomyces canus]